MPPQDPPDNAKEHSMIALGSLVPSPQFFGCLPQNPPPDLPVEPVVGVLIGIEDFDPSIGRQNADGSDVMVVAPEVEPEPSDDGRAAGNRAAGASPLVLAARLRDLTKQVARHPGELNAPDEEVVVVLV